MGRRKNKATLTEQEAAALYGPELLAKARERFERKRPTPPTPPPLDEWERQARKQAEQWKRRAVETSGKWEKKLANVSPLTPED